MDFKNFILKLKRKFVKYISVFFRFLPINNKKVIFDNFLGKGYGDNPKYIAEKLLNNSDLDLVWLVKCEQTVLPKGIRTVKYGSLKAMYEFATAKVWVDNVRNTFRTRKRKDQLYLQVWHGAYGCKLVEKENVSALSSNYVKDAINDGAITDAIIAADFNQEKRYRESFWLNEKTEILKYGMPRNDFIVNNSDNKIIHNKIRFNFGVGLDTYLILYLPTFRDNGSTNGYIEDLHAVLNAFKKKRNGKCIMLVRFHPNERERQSMYSYSEEIINCTEYPDLQEISIAADCVISDYSSGLFDFAIQEKPAFIYAADIDEYKKVRGIYSGFYEYPYPHAYSVEELISEIESFDYNTYSSELKKYFDKNPTYDKGMASVLAAEWIINKCN